MTTRQLPPGSVLRLAKSVTFATPGILHTYELLGTTTVSVLVLPATPTPEQLAKIKEILGV